MNNFYFYRLLLN